MLKSPITFLIANLLLCLILLSIGGYAAAMPFSVLLGLEVILFNYRIIGFPNACALAIVTMMIFDSDFFSFTTLNLRLWYILLLPLISYYLYQRQFFRRLPYNSNTIILLIISALTLLWFIIDPIDAKLSIIKYLVFGIGVIFTLKEAFRSIARRIGLNPLIDFFITLALFVALWGLFQFSMNITGRGVNYQEFFYNIRPDAFFSETTWYAEYLVFGIIFAYYRYKTSGKFIYILIQPFFLLGIILSVTRNAFLALAVWLLILFGLALLRRRIKPLNPIIIVSALFLLIIGSSYLLSTFSLAETMVEKFTKGDASSRGRIEALEQSLELFTDSPVIGHGFAYNSQRDRIIGSGTAIGAKNANMILMFLHIYGLVGTLAILWLICDFLTRQTSRWIHTKSLESKVAISLLMIFISMSMFAPIHQFPFGMFIVAAAILFGTPTSTNTTANA